MFKINYQHNISITLMHHIGSLLNIYPSGYQEHIYVRTQNKKKNNLYKSMIRNI
jgi:hypothetical protein